MSERQLHAISILILEDSRTFTQLLKNTLRNIGVRTIHQAGRAREAIDILECNKVDIVLADYYLEETTGVEFIKAVRKGVGCIDRSIPCILLTSESRRGVVSKALMSGIDAYLIKPVCAGELRDKILAICSGSRPLFHKWRKLHGNSGGERGSDVAFV